MRQFSRIELPPDEFQRTIKGMGIKEIFPAPSGG